jgi:ribosomal protein S18 acetylase RimI-like enzyme
VTQCAGKGLAWRLVFVLGGYSRAGLVSTGRRARFSITRMYDDVVLVTDPPSADEFADLRVAVGWTRIPPEVAERALANSLHVVGVRQRDRLVGFGRIVGDGAMRFYVEDVAIVPELQGRTLGRLVMDALLAWLDLNVPPCGKTYLMAASGSVGFYERYGFERRADGEPGMWRRPKKAEV